MFTKTLFLLGLSLGSIAEAAVILPTANFTCKLGDQSLCTSSASITQLGEVNGVSGVRVSTLSPIQLVGLGNNLTPIREATILFSAEAADSTLPVFGQSIPVSFDFDITLNGDATFVDSRTTYSLFGAQGQTVAGLGSVQFDTTTGGHIANSGNLLYQAFFPLATGGLTIQMNTTIRYTGTGTVSLSAPNSFLFGASPAATNGGAVPEPASVALCGLGLAMVAVGRWRQRRS